MKKIISCILSVLFVISCTCSVTSFANAMDSASFSIGSAENQAGGTVEIPIEIKNNPGITSFRIVLEYDSVILKLTNISFKEAAQGFNTGTSQIYDSPYSISGYNSGIDIYNNGQIAVLTFEINQYAEEGKYDISLSYDEDDVFNMAGDNVPFDLNNGFVEVTPCRHTGGEWEYLEEENCTNDGIMIKICDICGREYERKTVDPKDHNFSEWAIEKKATCTENGEKSRVCSVCTYEETEIINAFGHSFGEWEAIESPDCTNSGCNQRICEDCGFTEAENLNPKGHSHKAVKTVAPTCSEMGYILYKCECDDTYKDSFLNATGHKYTDKVTTDATCTSTGVKTFTCSNCGDIYTEIIAKIAHTYTTTTTKATTSKNGSIVTKCSVCGNVSKNTIIYYPKTTKLSSVTAKSKGFTVKWKKQATQTTGYEIQYATDIKFTKNRKTVIVSKNSTTSKTISKLKAKKKYYVRIRTYKTVKVNNKSTKVYSNWSKTKTVTTKK